MTKKLLLLAFLIGSLLVVTPVTAADDSPDCASLDDIAAVEAECEGRIPQGLAVGQRREDDRPRNCRLHNEVIFWTANDKKVLRFLQDDISRAHGPRFRPVAEMTLGAPTGWANWVTGAPGRTWFDAGIEFRRRMVAAGYDFSRGETWLLNEADRSTRLDEPPYTRQAIMDVVRGLALGDGTGPVVPWIVELGIQYSHQTMPDQSPGLTYRQE